MGKTLFEKVWDDHVVDLITNGQTVLYIDKHLIHEVTSPQAFAGLKRRNLKAFRPHQTLATADHNVPTINQHLPIKEELSRNQVETLSIWSGSQISRDCPCYWTRTWNHSTRNDYSMWR